MRLKGKDLALYVGQDLCALSKSCNLEVTSDIIETSNIVSGKGKTFINGRYSWQITTECLIVVGDKNVTNYLNWLKKGTRLSVALDAPGIDRISGDVIVKSLSLSGAVGSMATYSVSLTGTGPLYTS